MADTLAKVPILTDEGIETLVDYIYQEKWVPKNKELEIGPSRRIFLKDGKPFTQEPPIDNTKKFSMQDNIFISIIEKMNEDMHNNPTFLERLSRKNNEYAKYREEDFYELIDFVNSGKIQEAKNTELGKYIYDFNCYFSADHIGNAKVLPLTSTNDYISIPMRIYINTSNGQNAYAFLSLYIDKCLKHGLPYDMKGVNHTDQSRTDGTVLYINAKDIEQYLVILNEIKNEHPEYISTFGAPLASAHNESYFAICQNTGSPYGTYNLYFDALSYASFIKTSASLLLEKYKDVFTPSQINILTEYSSDYAFSTNPRTKTHLDVGLQSTLKTFLDEYKPHIEKLMQNHKEQFLLTYKAKLYATSSLSIFQDLDHLDFPACFSKEFYDTFDVKTLFKSDLNSIKDICIKKEKKPVSIDMIKQVAGENNFNKLVITYMQLGHPVGEARGKSTEELKKMIFNEIRLDDTVIIKALCGGKVLLQNILLTIGVPSKDVIGKSMEDLQKTLILTTGLDVVINARENYKTQEKINPSLVKNHKYESVLFSLRAERGLMFLTNQEYISMSIDEKAKFIADLPRNIQEDILENSKMKNIALKATETSTNKE